MSQLRQLLGGDAIATAYQSPYTNIYSDGVSSISRKERKEDSNVQTN